MNAETLRLIVIALSAIAAALSFFLGAAQNLGVSPMVATIIGAILAAINVTLGFLPSFAGRSGLDPSKTEKEVALNARRGDLPRGMA